MLQSNQMISVFLHQENAKTEAEAKQLLRDAKKEHERFVGGRILPPARANQKKWIVQAFYADDQDRPPMGMARLSIPGGKKSLRNYGITRH